MYNTNTDKISETDILRTMKCSNSNIPAVIFGTVKWGYDGNIKKESKPYDNNEAWKYMYYNQKKKNASILKKKLNRNY